MPTEPPPFLLPADYPRIKVVRSFDELVETPFADGVNALCWERTLAGDFAEIVRTLGDDTGIVSIDDAELDRLRLSDAGQVARDCLFDDLDRLCERDLSPSLDCVYDGKRDLRGGPIATDVFSFHADSATAPADSYLCSYTVAPSEGLRNDQAIRRVDIPETRAALLALYGGADDDGFRDYLHTHFYDLHYAPLPHARPFSFGLGNLWRIAIACPGSAVPPCIHRAPATLPGQPPRLLLIS